MITTAPCGCPTVPIDKFNKVKSSLLSGKMIWFDEQRCEEHDDGSNFFGFMIYHKGKVLSEVFLGLEEAEAAEPKMEVGTAEFTLDNALKVLKQFHLDKFDFSSSDEKIQIKNGQINVVCKV
ncbi:hypothetical protein [Viridibacillus arvi]|uniref:hypothetical protein n=1 Tax=Viridibacillus arvi TaxID=263475 RepID=UPI0034CF38E4